MRRLVVSDIHGEGRRLVEVLAKANYDAHSDRLFLLGDYVDRGESSKHTVQVVQNLVQNGAVALLGNHDAVLLAYAQGDSSRYAWLRQWAFTSWLSQGGAQTMLDYGQVIPSDVVAFLSSLPLYHEEPDCILVHAGLRPGVALVDQSDDDLLWIRKEFHEGYTGKRVIFGHTPTNLLHGKFTPWYGVDKIGIDTGSCFRGTYGGCLTLFDLDTHQIWFE